MGLSTLYLSSRKARQTIPSPLDPAAAVCLAIRPMHWMVFGGSSGLVEVWSRQMVVSEELFQMGLLGLSEVDRDMDRGLFISIDTRHWPARIWQEGVTLECYSDWHHCVTLE